MHGCNGSGEHMSTLLNACVHGYMSLLGAPRTYLEIQWIYYMQVEEHSKQARQAGRDSSRRHSLHTHMHKQAQIVGGSRTFGSDFARPSLKGPVTLDLALPAKCLTPSLPHRQLACFLSSFFPLFFPLRPDLHSVMEFPSSRNSIHQHSHLSLAKKKHVWEAVLFLFFF